MKFCYADESQDNAGERVGGHRCQRTIAPARNLLKFLRLKRARTRGVEIIFYRPSDLFMVLPWLDEAIIVFEVDGPKGGRTYAETFNRRGCSPTP